MIGVDQYEFIRTSVLRYGKSIREVARETGHSRVTIRKAVRGQEPAYRRKKPKPMPVMGPVVEIVDQWLMADSGVPKKQRHTARRIYDRLVEEHGFQGAESTVRHYVRNRKAELGLRGQEAMVPLEPEPGREAEVDWGEAVVKMDGRECKVKLFCFRSRASGRSFVRAYPGEGQEMFFDGHIHAFAYFGGIFPVVVYDNLKTAVLKVLKGRQREEQRAFQLFRGYYTFEARFCNVARGNEKGGVEGFVKYARSNFLVPIPEVADFDELNQMLLSACDAYNQRVLGGRDDPRTIEERHEEERKLLLPPPSRAYPNERPKEVRVDKYQVVRVANARYSVPTALVGQRIMAYIGCDHIRLSHRNTTVAQHKRAVVKGDWVLDPLHYLQLLQQKPGAFDDARPIRSWRKQWPESYERFLGELRKHVGHDKGSRAFLEVLTLHREHEQGDVETAVELALENRSINAEAVKCLLLQLTTTSTPSPPPLHTSQLPVGAHSSIPIPDTCQYDQLCAREVQP